MKMGVQSSTQKLPQLVFMSFSLVFRFSYVVQCVFLCEFLMLISLLLCPMFSRSSVSFFNNFHVAAVFMRFQRDTTGATEGSRTKTRNLDTPLHWKKFHAHSFARHGHEHETRSPSQHSSLRQILMLQMLPVELSRPTLQHQAYRVLRRIHTVTPLACVAVSSCAPAAAEILRVSNSRGHCRVARASSCILARSQSPLCHSITLRAHTSKAHGAQDTFTGLEPEEKVAAHSRRSLHDLAAPRVFSVEWVSSELITVNQGRDTRQAFLKQIFRDHSYQKKKRQNYTPILKGHCHRHIMEIQRPPEVASKTVWGVPALCTMLSDLMGHPRPSR